MIIHKLLKTTATITMPIQKFNRIHRLTYSVSCATGGHSRISIGFSEGHNGICDVSNHVWVYKISIFISFHSQDLGVENEFLAFCVDILLIIVRCKPIYSWFNHSMSNQIRKIIQNESQNGSKIMWVSIQNQIKQEAWTPEARKWRSEGGK